MIIKKGWFPIIESRRPEKKETEQQIIPLQITGQYKSPIRNMKSKKDLDVVLFKLKGYYDAISIMQQEKNNSMNNLRFLYERTSMEIQEIHDHSNIDSDKLKSPFIVSIVNNENVKETKEKIQQR